jgi:hypothetical protein
LAIINVSVINIDVHISLLYANLHYFGYMPRNDISGSYGNSTFRFISASVLISIVAALIYIPHQQCIRIHFTENLHQHLMLIFLMVNWGEIGS